MGNFACQVTPEDVTEKTSWSSSRARTRRQFLDVFLGKWKFMKKSAMHEVRQKKLMGRVVKLAELVKQSWKALSGWAPRNALRHFWKSTKNWKEAMTWQQVDKSTTGQVERNANRQSGPVHPFKDAQHSKCTFHTEPNQQQDRQRQSHVSESRHKKHWYNKKCQCDKKEGQECGRERREKKN